MGKVYGERWETVDSLPEGGQAHTYRVRDTRGDGETLYVLKRLKNPNRVGRFRREIEAVRNLSHPNILQLIDFDLEAEKPYLVTEYCPGGSLSRAEPFWKESFAKAIEIFQQVCSAVVYAHAKGVIHRDLKPDNIFLRSKDGPAVVGDFGICYLEEDGTRLTPADEVVGPIHFIAPELEDGRASEVSSQADVYSLGKLLYWLLSGGKMFAREKHREQQWDLKGHKLDSLLGWDNIYLEHVNRLLDLMIAYDPEERTSAADALLFSEKVVRLVEKEFTPIDSRIKQPCTYCGYGVYVCRALTNTGVSNFGIRPEGDCHWMIFACDKCGHVQMFRVDMAARKDWWKEESILHEMFEEPTGWENYEKGYVSRSTEVSHTGDFSLKKDGDGDPNGGFRKIGKTIGRGFMFSGWIYRPDKPPAPGNADRLSVEDENFNGYGFSVGHYVDTVRIEKRTEGKPKRLGSQLSFSPPRGEWYQFRFYVRTNGELELRLYDHSGEELRRVTDVSDEKYNMFDRIAVRGGFPYYVDDLTIESMWECVSQHNITA